MPILRNFEGVKPPARYDDVPWTEVDVEEASSLGGAWSTIDTIELDPVDSDPASPQSRNLTTTQAELDVGWYRLVWRDGDGTEAPADAVAIGEPDATVATLDDVAQVLGQDEVPESARRRVRRAIAIAEAWARRYLGREHLGSTEATTDTHWDVRDDALLPAPGPVTAVATAQSSTGATVPLPADSWSYEDGYVRLRPGRGGAWHDPRYAEEGLPRTYVRVVVTAEASPVDPLVREAVAHAAAAIWKRSPRLGKGLQGESLGDYSYTVAQLMAGDPLFEQARSILRSVNDRPVLVT